MRPTPIPDDEIWPGYERLIMRAPGGSDPTGDIRDVEMQHAIHDGVPLFTARFVLEEGDLERLQAGEPFWLTMWGHVVPFDVQMADPQ